MASPGTSPAAPTDSDIENTNAGPINVTPSKKSSNLRYAAADAKFLASLSQASPSQAKKALEAHITDTDRRIREASKLGTSLLEQKKQLSLRLKDVESQTGSDEIGPDLRQKLVDLEKEYNDLGRESARAFLSKSRRNGSTDETMPLSTHISDRPPSPSKSASLQPLTPLSRKQRNSSSRVDDLSFATEISTSLLSQVRYYQNALAEKEEALREANADNAKLTTNSEDTVSRLRNLQENEQRYKDESWNLETQIQDLSTQLKDASLREQKLSQSLKAANDDKAATDRESDELKISHDKLAEQHSALRKKHDTELSTLRRNVTSVETEKDALNKRISELTTQNEDLAKAVAYRLKSEQESQSRDIASDPGLDDLDHVSSDDSPSGSPTKGTPRHGGLESETLKSSLHHAHRMIQNLKNNIHREKTEKIELRRMLQDARDELETTRAEGSSTLANAGRRRKPNAQPDLFKKPARPDRLGAAKSSTEEIINDPSWEEYDDHSPTRDRGRPTATRHKSSLSTDQSDGFETANEENSSHNTENEGFETASERDAQGTETDDFETAESVVAGDSDGDLTETESNHTSKQQVRPSLKDRSSRVRSSFQSTASDDGDLLDLQSASFESEPPRYKLRLGRGGLRKAAEPTSATNSPASFISNQSTPTAQQNLAAELEDLGDESSIASNTPSRSLAPMTPSPQAEGKRNTVISPLAEKITPKLLTVDFGTMTDAWEPETVAVPAEPEIRHVFVPVVKSQVETVSTSTQTVEDFKTPTQDLNKPIERGLMVEEAESASINASPDQDAKAVSLDQPNEQLTPVVVPFEMSTIATQYTEPITPVGFDNRADKAATFDFFAPSDAPVQSNDNLSLPATSERQLGAENASATSVERPGDLPTQIVNKTREEPAAQLAEASESQARAIPAEPTQIGGSDSSLVALTPTKSEGTQTTISSDQIGNLIKEKNRRSLLASTSTGNLSPSQSKQTTPGRTMSVGSKTPEQLALLDLPPRSPRRSGSAGNLARSAGTPPATSAPPLPADHKQVIAAMSKSSSASVGMLPPAVPASAAPKALSPQPRPRTPNAGVAQGISTTRYSNAPRNRTSSITARSEVTRRSSVSSFASEVDEHFDRTVRANEHGFDMGTDPRMIQAITQSMIGEFMYKYTRKAGRGQHSDNRHRRFFWIHPYTRTLYWCTQDPARAAKSELKAKSVPIEAVRVVLDENHNPPGLHYKSIIVVTPSRDIKLTAPTSHRHDTWFEALSYLLVRNNANDRESDLHRLRPQSSSTANPPASAQGSVNARPTTSASVTAADVAEFNPTLGSNRTPSRGYSYRLYTDASPAARLNSSSGSVIRASSGSVIRPNSSQSSVLGNRASSASVQGSNLVSGQGQGQYLLPRLDASATGSLSSVAESAQATSGGRDVQSTPTRVPTVIDADGFKKPTRPASSTANTSAENQQSSSSISPAKQAPTTTRNGSVRGRGTVRDSIQPEQASSSDLKRSDSTLENVRACCDGKHDVGHLDPTASPSLSQRHSRAASAASTKSRSRVSLRESLRIGSQH